jgi:hypothetical protein
MPPEVADDYDIWITVGQALHSLDESLLDEWDEWSKQSDKYQEGECHRRWLSFSKGGGRTLGSLVHAAKENGWQPSQDHKVMNVDDATLDHVSKMLETIEEDLTKGRALVPQEIQEVSAKANKTKWIKGEKKEKDTNVQYLHRGIGTRSFTKTLTVADTVEVRGAEFTDGILRIALENIIPDSKKPRKIEIGKSLPEFKPQLLQE